MDNPQFIDTHCHFDFSPFTGHEEESLLLARQAGVTKMILPAVTAGRFDDVMALATRFPSIYAALGLHPLYISQHGEQQVEQLANRLQEGKKVVAIGEMGLDFYMDNPQQERQIWLLRQQLQLAKQHDLPVIIHSRQAHDILARELKRAALPRTGVIHGFSGSLEQANTFLKLGYYLGVGGTITYPRAQKTRQVIATVPLTSLLFETDAPDMPLMGFQGQPNRPERVATIFTALCQLRSQEEPMTIAATIYQNTLNCFPPLALA